MNSIKKVGLGGGCHWCTESVFLHLKGVQEVEQGWISSSAPNDEYSEAVIVHFDSDQITLKTLIAIHLRTHSCTSKHPMRNKYRSAVYSYNEIQTRLAISIINDLQSEFDCKIITEILPSVSFKKNIEKYRNYYEKNSQNQFCKRYIDPKLTLLMEEYGEYVGR